MSTWIRVSALRVMETVESLAEKVGYFALWGIVSLIFFQVVFRYFLKIGLPWPDELARYLHLALVFLCLGGVSRNERHIRIELLRQKLPGTTVDQISLGIQLIVSLVLVAGAIEIIGRIGAVQTPALGMPLFLFFLPPLLGFILLAFESGRKLFTMRRDKP